MINESIKTTFTAEAIFTVSRFKCKPTTAHKLNRLVQIPKPPQGHDWQVYRGHSIDTGDYFILTRVPRLPNSTKGRPDLKRIVDYHRECLRTIYAALPAILEGEELDREQEAKP